MTSRERILNAVAHREPDKVPVTLAYETPADIARRYGRESFLPSMRQDVYPVSFDEPPMPSSLRERYLPDLPAEARVDCWGVARWGSSTGESQTVLGPLGGLLTPQEINAFPWPEVAAPGLVSRMAEQVTALHEQGLAVQGAMSQTIFEPAWNMMGMERLFVALYEDRDLVECLYDRITERKQTMAVHFARAGVDILRLGDDVAGQRGMMMDPRLWRVTLKGRLAAIIAGARAVTPGLPVFYHSDGDVTAILDDLIETGVTILNPVQPECMDPFAVKKRYGDRLTLWGTIGSQSVLPFGTPPEIRELVRTFVRDLGRGGGYVIGPTHSIEHDVPWENIQAFYEAVEEK